MARLKKRSSFSVRDPEFAAKLEMGAASPATQGAPKMPAITDTQHPADEISAPKSETQTFLAKHPDPALSKESDLTLQEASKMPSIADTRHPADEMPATKPQIQADLAEDPGAASSIELDPHSQEVPESRLRSRGRSVKKSETSRRVEIRIAFLWPRDLVERAQIWADKARSPVNLILKKGWMNSREKIVADLEKGIQYKDIPHDSIEAAGVRLEARLLLSERSHQRLVEEIDPENMIGLAAPIGRWARKKALPMIDAYLKDAGY